MRREKQGAIKGQLNEKTTTKNNQGSVEREDKDREQ